MNNVEKQILNLINSTGKSVTKMSNPLKIIGDGSMEKGIKKIADYMLNTGLMKGRVQGVVGTITITGIALIIGKLIKDYIKEKKLHKEEGEAILKALEDGLSDEINETDDSDESDKDDDSACDSVI